MAKPRIVGATRARHSRQGRALAVRRLSPLQRITRRDRWPAAGTGDALTEVSGTAEIADEGDEAWEHIDKMHRKYHGSGEYPRGGPQRVLVRIHPEKVSTMGFEDE